VNTAKALATYRRLRQAPLWRLLASSNGPVVLAVLQAHLTGETRRLPASVLFERVARDLEALRDENEALPQAAQAYVVEWLKAGYLARRYPADAAEEEYELTAAGAAAIRFVDGLIENRSSATESRLSTVIQQLVRLAEDTETNREMRLAALEAERARIDREIEAVRQGRFEALPEERALERVRDTIGLAGELAGDFRRVRDEFEQLNRSLRERIMDSDGSRGEVLEALFAGVDLIAESDAGRTFYAFWRLLTDPEQRATLEEALEGVLSRDFAGALGPGERRFLLRLVHRLLDEGNTVHEVLQHFARSLKQFVQSREYLEQRRMNQLLRDAQRGALALKDSVRVTEGLGHALWLTTSTTRSLSQWVLYDPEMSAVSRGMAAGDPALIDLDTISGLVAQSEIDFRALVDNIRAALAEGSPVTIGGVMARTPAAQGLGSVVGYLALGSRHGIVEKSRAETVSWRGEDAVDRKARIPTVYFTKEKAHELA